MSLFKKILLLCAGLFLTSSLMANPVVQIDTNLGKITIELDEKNAPISTKNFLMYVNMHFYNNTLFHRVIPGFMIQGGGFTKYFKQKPTDDAIKNEANNGLKNTRGSVAMARTMDPNSATSQFFINVADNTALDYTAPTPKDWGYAVFGHVTSGMDIVDKIAAQKTHTEHGHQNVPIEPVIIKSITRLK